MQGFKWFLINEERAYLGHKVSDVLTSVQDLEEDLPGMGSRHIQRIAEDIANQIRKILHGQWSPRHTKDLKDLQKIGIALMKAIDEKGDLKTMIPVVSKSLQEISGKLGIKTNDIQPPEEGVPSKGQDGEQANMQLTADGPQPQPQPQQQQATQLPQQPPQQPMQGLPGMPM